MTRLSPDAQAVLTAARKAVTLDDPFRDQIRKAVAAALRAVAKRSATEIWTPETKSANAVFVWDLLDLAAQLKEKQ